MKTALIVSFAVMTVAVGANIALAVAVAEESPKSPVFNYHVKFGVPRAVQLKSLEESTARNVSGSVTDISITPYQLGLVIRVLDIFTSVCGASLISSNRVLTAAHCNFDGVNTAQAITVVAGSNTLFSGGQRQEALSITMHPSFNQLFGLNNDIALIAIPNLPLIIDSNVIRPISLPSGSNINNAFVVGQKARASGFGTSDGGSIGNNQVLCSVELSVITNQQCSAVYGSLVNDSIICTSGEGGQGTCGGDSGGPLAFNGSSLIGVTLFSAPSFPAVYAKTSSYISWINSQL